MFKSYIAPSMFSLLMFLPLALLHRFHFMAPLWCFIVRRQNFLNSRISAFRACFLICQRMHTTVAAGIGYVGEGHPVLVFAHLKYTCLSEKCFFNHYPYFTLCLSINSTTKVIFSSKLKAVFDFSPKYTLMLEKAKAILITIVSVWGIYSGILFSCLVFWNLSVLFISALVLNLEPLTLCSEIHDF